MIESCNSGSVPTPWPGCCLYASHEYFSAVHQGVPGSVRLWFGGMSVRREPLDICVLLVVSPRGNSPRLSKLPLKDTVVI